MFYIQELDDVDRNFRLLLDSIAARKAARGVPEQSMSRLTLKGSRTSQYSKAMQVNTVQHAATSVASVNQVCLGETKA